MTARTIVLFVLIGTAGLSLCPGQAGGQEDSVSLGSFLTETLGLSEDDLEALVKGDAVVKVFKTDDDRELTLAGAIRVAVPREFVLQRCHDLKELRGKERVMKIERIDAPPKREEFNEFVLPDDDQEDLRKAKKGDSNVKITSDVLQRLQKEVDWSGNPSSTVNAIIQDMLWQRTTAYLEGGASVLDPYIDKKDPQTVVDGLKEIIGPAPVLYEYVPEFHEYSRNYPESRLEGTSDYVYCVLEDFGMKPTMSLKHIVIYDPPDDRKSRFLMTEVVFYASHYFQTSFSVMAWIEEEIQAEGNASYIVWARRLLFDGDLKGVRRSTASRRLRDAMKDVMILQNDRLKTAYEKR